MRHFEEAEIPLGYFERLFDVAQPSDFLTIPDHYRVSPERVLVISDDLERDVQSAIKYGLNALHVPEYVDFMNQIPINNLVLGKIQELD